MKRLIYIISLLLLAACAQTTPLSGGPKDIYAPAIDSAKTSPYNGQINFQGSEMRMKFNEYISLNKASENIIVIPQMGVQPTFEARNKRLKIIFNEPLQENTTYNITFNGAIQDITEKNDSVFQYVFSTGDYIDSLKVFGRVKNALTNAPVEQMLVGLYPTTIEDNFDSIPLKHKPTYLTQTKNTGEFELNYLKEGSYFLFAIKDLNKNLLYDLGEPFAFLSEQQFTLTPEETPIFELNSFTEKSAELRIDDVTFSYPGRLEVILSNPTDSFSVLSNLPLLSEPTGRSDSLIYWLDQKPVPKMRFYTELLGEKDTLKPIYKGTPDKEEEVLLTQKNNVIKGKLLPAENLIITFSEPILSFNREMIHFYDVDSAEVKIDSIKADVRKMEFSTFGTAAHLVTIDSAAIISVFDRTFEQNLSITFENEEADYYGSLIITMDTIFQETVMTQLLNDKGEIVEAIPFAKKMTFEKLLPGSYQLRLIFDVDNNGEWTSGSLKEVREPEKVIYHNESIKVKSKWEKEIDWILSGN